VLSISITLAIMSTADDDGMGDVATDEVDQDVLPMTQGMGLSHVVGD
jgi:hypothetical protein